MPPGSAQATNRIQHHIAAFLRFAPAPGQWRTALHTTVVMAAAILAITALAGLDVGPMALFGSLIALWNTGQPLRSRLRTFSVVACVLPGAMALGVLISPLPWLMAPVLAAVTLVAVTLYYAFVAGPGPGPLNTYFACALGTYLGGHTHKAWEIVLVTFCSCVLTGLLSLTDLVGRHHRAEQTAVAAARRAVDTYTALPARSHSRADESLIAARDHATSAVYRAWNVLCTARRGSAPSAEHRALESDLLHTESRLAHRLVADHFPGATARFLEAHGGPVGRPPLRRLLRHALDRHSRARLIAGRNALSAGVAVLIAQLAGVGHPYWAVLSSAIVLHSGADRNFTLKRALHRVLGTLLGVAVVAAIWSLGPTRPEQLAIQLIGVYGMNLLLGRQYTLAVVAVTAMAMMANTATSPEPAVGGLFADRVIETLVGCGVAVAVLWTTGRRGPRIAQVRQYHRTIDAIARLLTCVDRGEPTATEARHARRDVVFERERHGEMLTRALLDDSDLAAWLPVDQVLGHLTHDVLAVVWHDGAPAELSAGAARDAFMLSRRLREPRATDPADAARTVAALQQARRTLSPSTTRALGFESTVRRSPATTWPLHGDTVGLGRDDSRSVHSSVVVAELVTDAPAAALTERTRQQCSAESERRWARASGVSFAAWQRLARRCQRRARPAGTGRR
ncbi:FUSC family protein [Streptomyces sp. CL12-4]|uniref:FUSC family protein n=1 Tax=Streptomyces sp. CL12-4 TaxID=2810306 RepID=UPI001EFA5972|nr:FUSC family protein [Streptomyces sp. CL12-4]MCG8970346.1 FUSC family protein [Streptomyces sp. CL12-4]